MIVVLDLDDDDVPAVVERLTLLPRRPNRVNVATDSSAEGKRIRRVLGWTKMLEGSRNAGSQRVRFFAHSSPNPAGRLRKLRCPKR